VTAKPVRLALILAAFGLLSACNVILTKDPLFNLKDAAGAPPLRPGVWMFFKEADCKVDETKPFTEWPECAGGGLVAETELIGRNAKSQPDQIEREPYVLAAGDPRVIQIPVDIDLSMNAEATTTGDATATTSPPQSTHAKPYGYGAVLPTKLDAQGRIVTFTFWPIICGPPAPKDKDGNDTAPATLKPFPGLEMKKDDAVCTTTSQAAVRNAAKASRPYAEQPRNAFWIRDGAR
jgi:hypothetical protein